MDIEKQTKRLAAFEQRYEAMLASRDFDPRMMSAIGYNAGKMHLAFAREHAALETNRKAKYGEIYDGFREDGATKKDADQRTRASDEYVAYREKIDQYSTLMNRAELLAKSASQGAWIGKAILEAESRTQFAGLVERLEKLRDAAEKVAAESDDEPF